MNLNTLTDEQLVDLENKVTNETLTDEERQALTPTEPQDDNLELVVEVDADPEPVVDNSAPNPQPTKDNQTPPVTPPPAGDPAPVTPQPAVSEEVYNSLIAEHPQLAKFKNDENFLTNLSKSYVHLESKVGQTQQQPVLQPITDEQKLAELNSAVLKDVETRMLSNPAVMDALTIRDENGTITEILQLPKTPQELYAFKKNYPAEYLEVKMLGERMYDAVHKEHLTNAQYAEQAPVENQATLDKFMDDIAGYCKKIAPTATPEDLKIVGDKLQQFVTKTIPDGRYYEKRGKGFFLNGKALKLDFFDENPELIGKLAEINAKNSVTPNVQNGIKNVQRHTSMKTLANTNLNAPTKRNINLKDPRQLGKLSDEQLDRYELELLNK